MDSFQIEVKSRVKTDSSAFMRKEKMKIYKKGFWGFVRGFEVCLSTVKCFKNNRKNTVLVQGFYTENYERSL